MLYSWAWRKIEVAYFPEITSWVLNRHFSVLPLRVNYLGQLVSISQCMGVGGEYHKTFNGFIWRNCFQVSLEHPWHGRRIFIGIPYILLYPPTANIYFMPTVFLAPLAEAFGLLGHMLCLSLSLVSPWKCFHLGQELYIPVSWERIATFYPCCKCHCSRWIHWTT